jgi:recombinational DNA repair protein (RecF pathway)
MSHSIITSPGFVIQGRDYGENQVMASIFARELGLVLAVAQGIRTEASKLRPYIIEYAWGSYSFVRGKEMWRLVGAGELVSGTNSDPLRYPVDDIGDEIDDNFNRKEIDLTARVAVILRRFLQGEEPHPELFDALLSFFSSVKNDTGLLEHHSSELESLIVFRIMHLLGYIGNDQDIPEAFYSSSLSPELLARVGEKRQVINKQINRALKESQL